MLSNDSKIFYIKCYLESNSNYIVKMKKIKLEYNLFNIDIVNCLFKTKFTRNIYICIPIIYEFPLEIEDYVRINNESFDIKLISKDLTNIENMFDNSAF